MALIENCKVNDCHKRELTRDIDDLRAENERLTSLCQTWDRAMLAEIQRLREALQRIDGINDSPARFNSDIQAVIDAALTDHEKE